MTTVQPPEHKRGYQACNLCREKRVRCQLGSVDAPHKPPCARCRRENRECLFSATRKRKPRRAALPLHGESLMQSQPRENSATTMTTDGFQSDARSLSSGNCSARAKDIILSSGSDHRPVVPSSGGEQTAATLLKGLAYTSNDTLNLLHEAGQRSEYEHARVVGRTFSSAGMSDKRSSNSVMANLGSKYSKPDAEGTGVDIALEAWTNLRFVRSGLFSAEEALAFVDHFHNFLAPFSPILSSHFKHPSQHPKLVEEEPILTVTILMLASRYMKLTGPGATSRSYVIHDRLWKYLQGMISRVFWSEEHSIGRMSGCRTDSVSHMGSSPSNFRSLGTCEALLLLLEWHPRALHFPSWDEDTTSIIVKDTGTSRTSTKDTARYGRLRSGIDWLARSDRMCWSLLGTAFSVAAELGVFHEHYNTITNSHDRRGEVGGPSQDQRVYRIQQLIWAYSIQTSGRLGWKYSTPIPIAEQCLVPEDDTTHCWVGVATLLKKGIDSLYPSQSHTKKIVKNGEYVKCLQGLQPLLQDWEKKFEDAKLSRSMRSILGIEYGYVRVYIYCVALQAIIERRTQDTEKGDIESPIVPNHDKADNEYLRQITAAARSVLRIVVYDVSPDDNLKYIPVRTYSRILAGSLCLLKTCAIDINEDEAGTSLKLVDDAAEALRNSVIDDLVLSARWGELLQALSSNLRTRLEQMSASKGGLSNNTTPSQGAPGNQSSNRDQYFAETSVNPLFGGSQQNTAASNFGNSDIFNASNVYCLGGNQVNMDINGCASSWDDLSSWLDPLGHVSAANVSQMPWHGDQGMYGMLEPFMGGSGYYHDLDT